MSFSMQSTRSLEFMARVDARLDEMEPLSPEYRSYLRGLMIREGRILDQYENPPGAETGGQLPMPNVSMDPGSLPPRYPDDVEQVMRTAGSQYRNLNSTVDHRAAGSRASQYKDLSLTSEPGVRGRPRNIGELTMRDDDPAKTYTQEAARRMFDIVCRQIADVVTEGRNVEAEDLLPVYRWLKPLCEPSK